MNCLQKSKYYNQKPNKLQFLLSKTLIRAYFLQFKKFITTVIFIKFFLDPMGLFYNHLATLVCGVFAAVLTFLWPIFVDYAEVLDAAFLYSVPIMWFLTVVCFVAQISADYAHGGHKPSKKSGHKPSKKSGKKIVYTADGRISE